jgi:hypothetical protein
VLRQSLAIFATHADIRWVQPVIHRGDGAPLRRGRNRSRHPAPGVRRRHPTGRSAPASRQ